jgi:hypothetical protein
MEPRFEFTFWTGERMTLITLRFGPLPPIPWFWIYCTTNSDNKLAGKGSIEVDVDAPTPGVPMGPFTNQNSGLTSPFQKLPPYGSMVAYAVGFQPGLYAFTIEVSATLVVWFAGTVSGRFSRPYGGAGVLTASTTVPPAISPSTVDINETWTVTRRFNSDSEKLALASYEPNISVPANVAGASGTSDATIEVKQYVKIP